MVIYRLIDNAGFDVTVETDASDNQKEFFITDIRGLDSSEVEAGFNIGIQQYNESQLIGFARDKSLALYSYDKNRQERCLVVPGVQAGRFNGTSSYLSVPNITLGDSGQSNRVYSPINVKLIFRITQDFLDKVGFDYTPYLWATDQNVSSRFFARFQPAPGAVDLIVFFFVTQNDYLTVRAQLSGDIVDRCNELEIDITQLYVSPFTRSIALKLNGQTINTASKSGIALLSQPTFLFDFGAALDGSEYQGFFEGIMRDISVSVAGTEVINIIDPSTGTNTGTGGDGTPTDIEQVTVII